MTMDTMTPERMADLADLHGGDLAAWPAPERAQAQALAATSPEAARVLAEARALDEALGALEPMATPSDALMARILADAAEVGMAAPGRAAPAAAPAPAPRKPGLLDRLFGARGAWMPAGAAAACLALGLMVGWQGAPEAPAPRTVAEAPAETLIDLALFADEADDDLFGLETL